MKPIARLMLALSCLLPAAPIAAQAPLPPIDIIVPAPPIELPPPPEPIDLDAPPAPVELLQVLPPDVARLIRTAMNSGDEAAVATMTRFALQAFPNAAQDVQVMRAGYDRAMAQRREAAEAERIRRLAAARITDNWDGSIELGASRTTGNSSSFGFYGAIQAERRGLRWDNSVNARAELQETNGVRSVERINASWRPRYRLGDDLQIYGLAQYEHDPIIGLDHRYTAGTGISYTIIGEPEMTLRFDGGPALRRTQSTGGNVDTAVGGRAAFDFAWKILPTLELKQDGSFIMDGGNESGRAITAIETRLFGTVRARLSYELLYERNSVLGTDSFGTSGRTTLVVGL
ncbi:DUF481 domain-containing protein [Sphingosinicella terrae]|uniref:DUF481 domain-containing protein n=1 Tax=Sphingosinicella terrae TaxID=2172047 RepID=UPI000E0D9E9E|nr:DUF481 domain-containing protein [Sphingosinicella terrae]